MKIPDKKDLYWMINIIALVWVPMTRLVECHREAVPSQVSECTREGTATTRPRGVTCLLEEGRGADFSVMEKFDREAGLNKKVKIGFCKKKYFPYLIT